MGDQQGKGLSKQPGLPSSIAPYASHMGYRRALIWEYTEWMVRHLILSHL